MGLISFSKNGLRRASSFYSKFVKTSKILDKSVILKHVINQVEFQRELWFHILNELKYASGGQVKHQLAKSRVSRAKVVIRVLDYVAMPHNSALLFGRIEEVGLKHSQEIDQFCFFPLFNSSGAL